MPTTTVGPKPDLIEVRGRITATQPITNVRTIQLEDKQRGEWVSVRKPNRKVMDWINFRAGCSGRLGFTVWQVVKDPITGKVERKPMPVFVGSAMMPVTTATTPALAGTPTDASRVVILRSPVTKKA